MGCRNSNLLSFVLELVREATGEELLFVLLHMHGKGQNALCHLTRGPKPASSITGVFCYRAN